jgi:hypothetical protein
MTYGMIRYCSKRILAILLLLSLVSCINPGRKAVLEIQDSIVLKARRPIPNFCLALFYYEKGKRGYLFADDKPNKAIRLFDLDSQTELDSIPLRDTGVNPIMYHYGFVVKDPDTLYLSVPDHYLYCINKKGELLKRIDYSGLKKKYPLLSIAVAGSRFSKGAVIRGNDIYFLQHDSRKNYFGHLPSDYRFLMKYDCKTELFSILPLSVPDKFWKDGKREMSLFLTYNNVKNEFVFGTQYSDAIYTSKDGLTLDETYHSRSHAIREFFPYTPPDDLPQGKYFYSLCSYSYNLGLIWDPYRKIYYRFVWPGVTDLDSTQSERISAIINNLPTFTIDVLDDDFNTIGSLSLPNNKYNSDHYFITEKGLYLGVVNTKGEGEPYRWVFHRIGIKEMKSER